jgi:hypothetical protein
MQPRYHVTLDGTGPHPALCVRHDHRPGLLALNGRPHPVLDAERALTSTLRGQTPPVLVLIGLGLGYTLDALEGLGCDTRVVAFEPLADALRHFHSRRDTLMFTIEPGGAYPTHSHLPSNDIFGDLQNNLRTRGLLPYVNLLHGLSDQPSIVSTVRTALDTRQIAIRLLSIDADGNVQRDFDLYLPMCAPGCVIVVDDYAGPGENDKTGPTKAAVDALVASGRARSLGVYGWGTWIGVYTPNGSAT